MVLNCINYQDCNKKIKSFDQEAVEDENDVQLEIRKRSPVTPDCSSSKVGNNENEKHKEEDEDIEVFKHIDFFGQI